MIIGRVSIHSEQKGHKIMENVMFELADRLKDELYSKLREEGYGDLIHETINANSLSSFIKEQISENDNLLPSWLEGLVNVYERNTVGVRKATK